MNEGVAEESRSNTGTCILTTVHIFRTHMRSVSKLGGFESLGTSL